MVAALLAAEVVCRAIGLPETPHRVYYTANRIEASLGEFLFWAHPSRSFQFDSRHNVLQDPPHGLMIGNLKMRQGYYPMPRWGYFDEHGCVSIDTNSLGFRDEEFAVEKKPNELRILALGDSMTYGLGVRLDLTWPQVLEARLRSERATPVEVINTGFAAGGAAPGGYDRWVADHGVLLRPTLVVLGLCLNDLHIGIGMMTYPAIKVAPILGGYSQLLDRTVQFVRQREARAQVRDLGSIVTPQSKQWVETQRGLRAIRDTLATAEVRFVVVVFPMMSQLEPDLYPLRSAHELVVGFCKGEGIRCLDLLPAFLGLDEQDLWVHVSDQHANDKGHAIQAERIHAFLVAEGLLN